MMVLASDPASIPIRRHPERSRFGRPPALSRGRAKRGGAKDLPQHTLPSLIVAELVDRNPPR